MLYFLATCRQQKHIVNTNVISSVLKPGYLYKTFSGLFTENNMCTPYPPIVHDWSLPPQLGEYLTKAISELDEKE